MQYTQFAGMFFTLMCAMHSIKIVSRISIFVLLEVEKSGLQLNYK